MFRLNSVKLSFVDNIDQVVVVVNVSDDRPSFQKQPSPIWLKKTNDKVVTHIKEILEMLYAALGLTLWQITIWLREMRLL